MTYAETAKAALTYFENATSGMPLVMMMTITAPVVLVATGQNQRKRKQKTRVREVALVADSVMVVNSSAGT